jgi:hypothetical protein
MNRKFLWGILIIAAIYSGLWFFTSHIVERKAYEYLDKLQKKNVISEYSGSITITGFPFSFNINIAHPRLKFQKQDPKYSANCDMLFDGTLAIDLGFFSDEITLQTIGDMHLKGNLNRYNFNYAISGKNSHYQIQLVDSIVLSAIKGSVGASGETIQDVFVALIDEISIHNEKLSLVNKLTNKLLIYANEIDFKIDPEGDSNHLNVRYRENISDAEFDKEFNVLASQILSIPMVREAVNKIDINVRNYFEVFSLDRLGKINHKIDLEVDIENGSSSIKVNKLFLNDAAYNIDATGTLSMNGRDKLDMEFKSKFSNQWYNLARIYADKLQLQGFGKKSFAQTSNSVVLNLFSSVFGFFTDLFTLNVDHSTFVPKLHDMGLIKGNLNVDYKETGKKFELGLKKLKINTNMFAIDASGTAENPGTGAGDKYNLKALLTNYGYIVDSTVAYLNRVEHSAGKSFFVIFGKKLVISQNISNKIKFFLRRVSDDPNSNSNNLNLTIVNKDGGKCPSVGRYSNKEFCRAWESFIFNILLGELTGNLNPAEMSKRLLMAPGNIVTNLPATVGNLPKAAGNFAKNLLGGLFGSNSKKKQ